MKERIRQVALSLGFDLCGFANPCDPQLVEAVARYDAWCRSGFLADMGYLQRHRDKKADPKLFFPEVKSIVVLAVVYSDPQFPPAGSTSSPDPTMATYARGRDYHDALTSKMIQLVEHIGREGISVQYRSFVDAQAVLERFWAWRAGLGWIGKNSCLIHRKKGSFLYLGGLMLDLELPADEPGTEHCGKCTKCIDACPTQAIVASRQIDSRRCLAYHTIENRGPIPSMLGESIGSLLAGCDICQTVCPWNHPLETAQELNQVWLTPRGLWGLSLESLRALSETEYKERVRGSALNRIKYDQFKRNLDSLKLL